MLASAPPLIRRSLRSAGVVIAVLLGVLGTTSGCQSGSGSPSAVDSRGPLHVNDGAGGAAKLDYTGNMSRVRAVFGGLGLCTTGAPVTLRSVEFSTPEKGASASFAVRSVPAAGDRARPRSSNWAPLSARRGPLGGAGFSRRVPGSVVEGVGGVSVQVPCGPASPDEPRMELLTVLTGGVAGASASHMVLQYDSQGRSYMADVLWTFVLCGREGPSGCPARR